MTPKSWQHVFQHYPTLRDNPISLLLLLHTVLVATMLAQDNKVKEKAS